MNFNTKNRPSPSPSAKLPHKASALPYVLPVFFSVVITSVLLSCGLQAVSNPDVAEVSLEFSQDKGISLHIRKHKAVNLPTLPNTTAETETPQF